MILRSFLLAAVFVVSGALASSGSIEARLNRAAFPLSRFADRYEPVPRAVEAELRRRADQVLDPIRIAPASWFRRSFGIVPSTGDRRRILESVGDVEIWRCKEKTCSGCGGGSALGCVRAARVSGGTGVVATIHPCLYGQAACPPGAKPNVDAWIERMVSGVAFYKSGLQDRNGSLKRSLAASSAWIAETSKSVNGILGSCPGPYSVDAMKFLLSTESISLPNPAVRRCGEKYLAALRALPTKCPKLTSELSGKWAEFTKENFLGAPDILRGDAYAMKLLCRPSGATGVFTRFGGKPTLVLGDSACEGETPTDPDGFLSEGISAELRSKLEPSGCVPRASRRAGDPSSPTEKSATDVQLVD